MSNLGKQDAFPVTQYFNEEPIREADSTLRSNGKLWRASAGSLRDERSSSPTAIGCSSGLTKREYFAAKALQGFLANPRFVESSLAVELKGGGSVQEITATASVRAADALIKALNADRPT